MTKILTALSTSLDGFIAGPDDGLEQPLGTGGSRIFDWFGDGDTASRFYPGFRMSAASAEVFDAGVQRVGAVVTGRRTYDISGAWGGHGPLPGVPLVVLTHHIPVDDPSDDPPYTFVTTGIEDAVEAARALAGDKDVALMGAQPVQQCLRAGLLDEIHLGVVPVLLGGGVRLLDRIDAYVELELVDVVDAPGITHLSYRVLR